MIYSSSGVLGLQKYGDSLYFLKRHSLFLLVGWLIYFVIAQSPVIRMERLRLVFICIGLILLGLVLVPGLGVWRGGGAAMDHSRLHSISAV